MGIGQRDPGDSFPLPTDKHSLDGAELKAYDATAGKVPITVLGVIVIQLYRNSGACDYSL